MTAEQLRDHLLRHIGELGVGDAAPSAEDAEIATTVLTNAQAALVQLGVALWTIDDVPDYAVESLMRFAAPALAGHFGKSDQYPPQLEQLGLRQLRSLTSDRRTKVGQANYF